MTIPTVTDTCQQCLPVSEEDALTHSLWSALSPALPATAPPPRPVPPSASASPPLSYRQTQVSHKFKKQSTTTSPPLNLTLSSNLSSFLPGAVAFESILATFRLFDYLITSNVPSAQLTGVNKTEHSPHPSILHRSVSTAPVAHEHPCC